MTIFFTSDTHFGDRRILHAARRPFATIAEHDAHLVAQWQATVGPNDEVWHLGDVRARLRSTRGSTALLASLPGRQAPRHRQQRRRDDAHASRLGERARLCRAHPRWCDVHPFSLPAADLEQDRQGRDRPARPLARDAEAADAPVRRRRRCVRLSAGDAGDDPSPPSRIRGTQAVSLLQNLICRRTMRFHRSADRLAPDCRPFEQIRAKHSAKFDRAPLLTVKPGFSLYPSRVAALPRRLSATKPSSFCPLGRR